MDLNSTVNSLNSTLFAFINYFDGKINSVFSIIIAIYLTLLQ